MANTCTFRVGISIWIQVLAHIHNLSQDGEIQDTHNNRDDERTDRTSF